METTVRVPQRLFVWKGERRVKGKKPDHVALKLLSLRLDKDVYDYLTKHHPYKIQSTIRNVLKEYTTKHGATQNDNDTNE